MRIILKPKVEKSILFFGEYSSSRTSIVEMIPNKIKGQIVLEAKNRSELLEIVEIVNIDLLLIDSINEDDNTIKRKIFDLRKGIKLLLFNSHEINSRVRLLEENKETIISQFYTEKILFRSLKKIIYKENYNRY